MRSQGSKAGGSVAGPPSRQLPCNEACSPQGIIAKLTKIASKSALFCNGNSLFCVCLSVCLFSYVGLVWAFGCLVGFLFCLVLTGMAVSWYNPSRE